MDNELKCYITKKDGSLYKSYEEWKNTFLPWLNEMNSKNCPYSDPDSESEEYYKDLAKILNDREKMYFPKEDDRLTYEFCNKPFGLCAKGNDDTIIFHLKSDQIGFSAPQKGETHPYDWFLKEYEDKEQAKELVCKWIYNTRTIGAGFLWPMEKKSDETWNSNPYINWSRGKLNRQQDRVDLTLQLIERFYLKGINAKTFSEERYLYKWLRRFGDKKEGWNKFVGFFQFGVFLKDLKISELSKKAFLEKKQWKKSDYLNDLSEKVYSRSKELLNLQ